MSRRALRFAALVMLLAALPAAASAQDQPDGVQIVVVLDVSGSMGTVVLGDQLPAEVLALRDEIVGLRSQLADLESDQSVVSLQDEIDALSAGSEIEAATAAFAAALDAVEGFFVDRRLAESRSAFEQELDADLGELGCQPFAGMLLVRSTGPITDLDPELDLLCPDGLPDAERQALARRLAFTSEVEYAELAAAELATANELAALRTAAGLDDLSARMLALRDELGITELEARTRIRQEELDGRVDGLGLPTRLDLARLAVRTLLDLSRLDAASGGGASDLALVVFATNASVSVGLTSDLERVDGALDGLEPLDETNVGGGLTLALEELRAGRDDTRSAAVILLTDGNTNVGLSAQGILDALPQRIDDLGAVACTAGFATSESEVDAGLLQGLADRTGGEYLFVEQGEDLLAFLVACRQGLLGDVAGRAIAVAGVAEAEVARVEVPDGTCELIAAVTHLGDRPDVGLAGPAGTVLRPGDQGLAEQAADTLQVLTVADPSPGTWTVTASSAGGDAAFGVVLSTEPCAGPTTSAPAASTTVVAADGDAGDGESPVLLIVAGIALAVFAGGIIAMGWRQRGGRSGPEEPREPR